MALAKILEPLSSETDARPLTRIILFSVKKAETFVYMAGKTIISIVP